MIRSGTCAIELGLFRDDLMGSQADSSSTGTGQKGTVWVANMGTPDQSKRPVSGVLGPAEKPLPLGQNGRCLLQSTSMWGALGGPWEEVSSAIWVSSPMVW